MFYSVKFNRFNGYRSSRSELQISMDVICRVPLFKVSLKFKSRDFRCVLVMINAARFIETSCFGVHPYLWHLQRGLFLDTHEPMWRMREMFLRIESSLVKFSNANIDQFISILCIEGCEFGCPQCSGNAPDGTRGYGELAGQTPLGCGGPQALQWPPVAQGCQLQRIYPLVI